jgi:hypothetical protein
MKRTFVEQGTRGHCGDPTDDPHVITKALMITGRRLLGEGSLGNYVTRVTAAERARTEAPLRDAYEAGRSDGPRFFLQPLRGPLGVVFLETGTTGADVPSRSRCCFSATPTFSCSVSVRYGAAVALRGLAEMALSGRGGIWPKTAGPLWAAKTQSRH